MISYLRSGLGSKMGKFHATGREGDRHNALSPLLPTFTSTACAQPASPHALTFFGRSACFPPSLRLHFHGGTAQPAPPHARPSFGSPGSNPGPLRGSQLLYRLGHACSNDESQSVSQCLTHTARLSTSKVGDLDTVSLSNLSQSVSQCLRHNARLST